MQILLTKHMHDKDYTSEVQDLGTESLPATLTLRYRKYKKNLSLVLFLFFPRILQSFLLRVKFEINNLNVPCMDLD